MKYFNFDLRINEGTQHEGGKIYPVQAVFSKGGDAHGYVFFPTGQGTDPETVPVTTFPSNKDELNGRLEQIENDLYRRSDTDTRSPVDRGSAAKAWGRDLFDTVFSEQIKDLFITAVGSLSREENERLRIRLNVHPLELAAYPWEFLYWSELRDYLCLNRRFSIVRHQELRERYNPLKVQLPLRIFGMISLPRELTTLDAKRERAEIKKGMKSLKRGSVSLVWGANGTWSELRQNMYLHNWHVFHYIGHGALDEKGKQGVLIAVNKTGEPVPLDATTLCEYLDNPFMRLVVLNTCEGSRTSPSGGFSSIAAALAQRNIPAIVAFQYKVTDAAAIQFAQGFYGTLIKHEYIDAAVTEARLAMKEAGSMEWGSLVLHLRSEDGVLFELSDLTNPEHLPPILAAEEAYNNGLEKAKEGLYAAALTFYKQALPLYQQLAMADWLASKQGEKKVYEAMGTAYDKLNRAKEAEQAYQQAIRLEMEL